MDKSRLIHIGIEVFAMIGITVYFHRKSKHLEDEMTQLRTQVSQMSQRFETSQNPFLKNDQITSQFHQMEQTIASMNAYVRSLQEQLQIQTAALKSTSEQLTTLQQNIAQSTLAHEQLNTTTQHSTQPIQLAPVREDEDGIPLMTDQQIDDEIRALESDSSPAIAVASAPKIQIVEVNSVTTPFDKYVQPIAQGTTTVKSVQFN